MCSWQALLSHQSRPSVLFLIDASQDLLTFLPPPGQASEFGKHLAVWQCRQVRRKLDVSPGPLTLRLAWRRKTVTESNGRGQRKGVSAQHPFRSQREVPELGHHEEHCGCLLATCHGVTRIKKHQVTSPLGRMPCHKWPEKLCY